MRYSKVSEVVQNPFVASTWLVHVAPVDATNSKPAEFLCGFYSLSAGTTGGML